MNAEIVLSFRGPEKINIATVAEPRLDKLIGRPYEFVKPPPILDERVLRQEVMQMEVVVQFPIAEPKRESERFIERPIDPNKPWSAFGQIMFIKEHEVNGKKIKKIAAISIAYPGGVGTKMALEILATTVGLKKSDFEEWDGAVEGNIIAAGKATSDVMKQLGMMDLFVQNSAQVIKENHAQVDHAVVQHYFNLQEAREGFIDMLREDATAILTNPEFTKWSAVNKKYEGKGIYLVEGIIEDGIWDGGDPKGKRTHLVGIAADEPHKKLLQWVEKNADKMLGDGFIVIAEDTETVQNCGGAGNKCGSSKGCSEFFELMEGGLVSKSAIKLSEYSLVSGIAGSIAVSENPLLTKRAVGGGGFVYDRESCSTCGKDKFKEEGCRCSSQQSKAA